MAAGAGKVALVRNTTLMPCGSIAVPCNAAQQANIADLVGYGTGTTFFEGTGPTATLTNTTAALRKDLGCADTDVNSADFATGTPAPRNSTITGTPCVEVGPVVTVTISPAASTMFLGTPKQFTAVGTDENGRTSPTTFTWTSSDESVVKFNAAAEPRVDVLLNNAGAMFAWREITPDGFERTFALNHVAPFVLTHGLRERLFAAAPARVVNTSGALHHLATLHLGGLRLEHRYDAFYAYAHAKLCCVLFTRELARRWSSKQVTANCVHPGEVGDALRRPSRRTDPLRVLGHPPVRSSPKKRCELTRATSVCARICWSNRPLFLQGEAGASQPARRG